MISKVHPINVLKNLNILFRFLIIPTAIEFTGIESYERLYTERAERQLTSQTDFLLLLTGLEY
jgi:hypothetical protein